MPRGRKKDLTKPPARSLIQQRDYRDRKARYISDLEERCRKAEEENVTLKEEIRKLKATQGSVGLMDQRNPETAEAAADLFEKLSQASGSLARFQALASGRSTKPCYGNSDDTCTCDNAEVISVPPSEPLPSAFHSPDISTPHFVAEHASHPADDILDTVPTPTSDKCCAGIFECEGELEFSAISSNSLERWSGVRSTSGQRFYS